MSLGKLMGAIWLEVVYGVNSVLGVAMHSEEAALRASLPLLHLFCFSLASMNVFAVSVKSKNRSFDDNAS